MVCFLCYDKETKKWLFKDLRCTYGPNFYNNERQRTGRFFFIIWLIHNYLNTHNQAQRQCKPSVKVYMTQQTSYLFLLLLLLRCKLEKDHWLKLACVSYRGLHTGYSTHCLTHIVKRKELNTCLLHLKLLKIRIFNNCLCRGTTT